MNIFPQQYLWASEAVVSCCWMSRGQILHWLSFWLRLTWIKDDSSVIFRGWERNAGMDMQCDSLSGLGQWTPSWCVSGKISVLDKPGSVFAQVLSYVGPLCKADNKLFIEVIRCGLYISFCEQEEMLPCLPLLLRSNLN